MYNQTFVKAFQISDLFAPVANPVSVPESERLAYNSRVIWAVIAAMSVATIAGYWATGLSFGWSTLQAIGLGAGCDPMFLSASPRKVSRSSCSF